MLSKSIHNENLVTNIRVQVDGEKTEIVSFRLEQSFGEHHRFEIVLDNEFGNKRNTFDFHLIGKSLYIELYQGNNDRAAYGFSGIINEVYEESREGKHGLLRLKGGSPTILLERGPRSDVFDGMSLSQICQDIIEDIPRELLSLYCKPSFDMQPDFLMQYKESDWQFLQRLAAISGETLFYTGRNLIFGKYADEGPYEVMYDQELVLLRFGTKLLANGFELYEYIPDTNEMLYATPSISTNSRDNRVNAAAAESAKLTEKQAPDILSELCSGSKVTLDDLSVCRKIRTAAEAACVSGVSKTCHPRIGRLLEIKGHGIYRVLKVVHEMDQNLRYRCEFEAVASDLKCLPAPKIEMPSVSSIEGTVIETNDPKGWGRVRVDFPFTRKRYCGAWIRVMSPNAGSSSDVATNRGFVFVPEKGDRVMVGFEYGDPNRPYVMGSLFHGTNSKGGGENNHLKSIITRNGHTIEFDDAEESLGITIKDKNGNIIHLDSKGKNIEITAPETMTLNAKNIAMSAQENVHIHAGKSISSQADENASIVAGDDLQISATNIYTQAAADSMHSAKKHETISEKVRLDSTNENLELASGKEVDVQSTKKVKLF